MTKSLLWNGIKSKTGHRMKRKSRMMLMMFTVPRAEYGNGTYAVKVFQKVNIYTSKMKRDRREKTLAMDRRATPNGTFAPKEGVRRMTTIAIKDQMAKAVFPQITMAPSASGEIIVALMFDPRERQVMTSMTTTHIVPTAAKKLVKNRDPEM
jgi:hypothetical protein